MSNRDSAESFSRQPPPRQPQGPDSPPQKEADVPGVRDVGEAPDQPAQVDIGQARLPRDRKANEVPPPGLMGSDSGPSS